MADALDLTTPEGRQRAQEQLPRCIFDRDGIKHFKGECDLCQSNAIATAALGALGQQGAQQSPDSSKPRYFGIPGHCFNIDGEWWHKPGKCEGPHYSTSGPCCGETQAAQQQASPERRDQVSRNSFGEPTGTGGHARLSAPDSSAALNEDEKHTLDEASMVLWNQRGRADLSNRVDAITKRLTYSPSRSEQQSGGGISATTMREVFTRRLGMSHIRRAWRSYSWQEIQDALDEVDRHAAAQSLGGISEDERMLCAELIRRFGYAPEERLPRLPDDPDIPWCFCPDDGPPLYHSHTPLCHAANRQVKRLAATPSSPAALGHKE